MSPDRLCTGPERGQLLPAYELGHLPPEERAAFEAHLKECEACREELHAMAPYTTALVGEPGKIRNRLGGIAAPVPEAPAEAVGTRPEAPAGGARPSPAERILRRLWPGRGGTNLGRLAFPLAAAAALLLVLVLRPPSEGGVGGLARLDPVRYVPMRIRATGASATRQFREGMELYARGRYGEAIPRLSGAISGGLDEGADLDQARFFLGLSLLLDGRPTEALPPLEEAAASPVPVLADRALWYVAQAHLLLEDPDAAREILRPLSEASPGYGPAAAEQLLQLRGR